tara:strand:- start:69375 stop:70133 length:759 start_codon:yes stop_codon:yes gene_type:complete
VSFQSDIGIIGGSGFYRLNTGLTDQQLSYQEIETPYAKQKVKLAQERLANRPVYFLPRHGEQHNLPPHKINYRSNLWALKEAGVTSIIAVNAVGGIKHGLSPGTIVIPDQLIDYTWGREHSFFDGLNSLHDHCDFTFPYDSRLREILLEAAATLKMPVSNGGCFACTQGPRLETAAEIQKLKRDACDIVGMTGMPEAVLARELGIAYVCIALVVNPAAGLSDELISLDAIKKVLSTGLDDIRSLISASLLEI